MKIFIARLLIKSFIHEESVLKNDADADRYMHAMRVSTGHSTPSLQRRAVLVIVLVTLLPIDAFSATIFELQSTTAGTTKYRKQALFAASIACAHL
jgi:hypothetical protein